MHLNSEIIVYERMNFKEFGRQLGYRNNGNFQNSSTREDENTQTTLCAKLTLNAVKQKG